jgi:phosphohistidine phosphatase
MGLDVWQIRHSGKTRAEQTAKIFGAVLNPSGGVVAVAGLAPADDAKPVAEALAREERPIMIVGHKPFLAALAGLLVAEDPDRPVVEFRYAAIVCLTRAEDRWLIAWILTPEMAGA